MSARSADGTFKDYCDVIRTAGEGSPIQVDVLRYDTSEMLRGEIYGDTPIEPVFIPGDEVGDDVGTDDSVEAASYTYESVVDDLGRITVDVPTEWADRDTTPGTHDGMDVPYIAAATDLEGFINGFDTPGLLFFALPANTDVPGLLTQYGFDGSCTDGGITEYSDPVFTGQFQEWLDCGGTPNDIVTLVALPSDNSYTAVIIVQILTDADVDALDRAFATFNSAG